MDERLHKMQVEFLEKHKDADVLEFSERTKHCICAIYFSPQEKFVESPFRNFARAMLKAMCGLEARDDDSAT